MYKPNRIGPWPLVDTDGTSWSFPASPTMGSRKSYTLNLEDTTFYTAARATSFTCLTEPMGTIGGGQSMGVGVAISGAALPTEASLCSVAGGLRFDCSGDAAVFAVFGRSNGVTALATLANPYIMPLTLNQESGAAADVTSVMASFSTTLVLGDFGASDTEGTNPLCVGFVVVASGLASGAGLFGFTGSLSIHRFEQQINTFDPDR
jgi:hypothetical protein